MTLPPPYQPHPQPQYPQQPTGGYPHQPHPQSGYWQGQYPPPYAVPAQQGLPPMPPHQPPRKPQVGLGTRIGLIVGAVVVIAVIAGIANARKPAVIPATSSPAVATSASAPTSATAAVAPTAAPAPPGPARVITARDWAKIAKNPDAHVGESIVVYGQVKQFDSATGVTAFRANVDGVKHPVSYGYADYETNTVLAGDAASLGDLVQDDLFRAEVVVTGSVSYDTTLGGSTTAPQLSVTKIVTIGTAK